MKLYWARHGESEANRLGVFSNRGTKHPLTPKGIEQARVLAEAVAPLGVTRVFCSPILRAVQTAQVVCEGLGLSSFVVDFDLREYDVGVFEDRSDPESWKRFAEVEEAWSQPENHSLRLEGGESYQEVETRFRRFVGRSNLAGAGEGSPLVISHGGLLKIGLSAVVGNLTYPFTKAHPLANCELILVESLGTGWECRRWGASSPPCQIRPEGPR